MAQTNQNWFIFGGIVFGIVVFLALYFPLTAPELEDEFAISNDPLSIARRVLKSVPLIDGHNDLPNNMRSLVKNKLDLVDFHKNLTDDPVWGLQACASCHTDIARMRAGLLGAQLWVAYVNCETTQFKDAVEQTLEQIDVMKRIINKYKDEMQFVTTAQGILDSFSDGKIGSLLTVEGGHGIDSRIGILRMYYQIGVRCMTLTHSCNVPWVDASPVDGPEPPPGVDGLTSFGKLVIHEMNRLGMIVDLSHTSKQAQIDAIKASRAPIVFSHSNAWAVCDVHRNVHDEVLRMVTENNGIVMVNFFNVFVACNAEAGMADLALQINYIRKVAGVDHIGIGSDFDGISLTPTGLNDVSKYPDLFAYLAAGTGEDAWTEEDLKKLAGLNFIRVFRDVEKVRDEMASEGIVPVEDWIPVVDLGNNTECITP